jgi:putative redox protein
MKTRIKYIENVCLMAESESGNSLIIDGSPDIGGRNLGVRPMEMILMGLGGCTTMDILTILRKKRLNIKDCVIEIDSQRRDTIPKTFSKIHLHFIITGDNLNEKHVQQAVQLSVEKYCSVYAMLKNSVEISYDYEINA